MFEIHHKNKLVAGITSSNTNLDAHFILPKLYKKPTEKSALFIGLIIFGLCLLQLDKSYAQQFATGKLGYNADFYAKNDQVIEDDLEEDNIESSEVFMSTNSESIAPFWFKENTTKPKQYDLKYLNDSQRIAVPRMNETFWKTQIATRTPIPLERQKYVELDENVFLYSNWLDEHDHYATWDTKAVNPYGFDGRQFKDTLNIQLFDPNDEASFSMPVDSRDVTSYFGMRRMTWHYGADIRVKHGSEIKAAFDGVVRIAKYNRGGYGYYIMLRHANGSETLYGHLSAFNVSVGDEVKAGDVIGFGGSTGRSTGPHLHFEIRYLGNALNPHDIFDFRKGEIISADITISPDSFAYLHEAYKIRYHKIRRGDSLSRIARQYGTSVNTICRLNGISPNTTIYPGRSIRIK